MCVVILGVKLAVWEPCRMKSRPAYLLTTVAYFWNGLDEPTKTISKEKLYLSIWCSNLLRSNVVETCTSHPWRITFLLSFKFLLVRCLIIFFILCLLDHQTWLYMSDQCFCLFFKMYYFKICPENYFIMLVSMWWYVINKCSKIY